MDHFSLRLVSSCFVLCLLSLSALGQAPQQKFDSKERSVLLKWKAMYPYAVTFFDWDSNTSCCTWPGISCDSDGHVISLSMASSSGVLSGIIPWDYFRQLSFLRVINLSGQNLSGPALPEYIGEMKSLIDIVLRMNSLSGEIPASISQLQNLTSLDLSENNVHGNLSFLSSLPNLSSLNLRGNNFSGPIPDFTGAVNLNELYLSSNGLTGSVPKGFASLKSLVSLELDNNLLSGKISDIISQMNGLMYLDVSNNDFLDVFPSIRDDSKLQYLDLSYNHFYGPIPSDAFQSTNLQTIRINDNFFNGPAPMSYNRSDSGDFVISRNCFKGIDAHSERCKEFQGKMNGKYRMWMIVILIVTSILLLAIFVLVLKSMCFKRGTVNDVELSSKIIRQLTVDEIRFASSNFKDRIGGDDTCVVFRGILNDGKSVAIKLMHENKKYAAHDFKDLVNRLFDFPHPNLLNLIGYCSQNEQMFIYEYPVIGSISEYLHGSRASEFPLAWDIRMKIAIHMAMAIEFVNASKIRATICRKIKSCNALLCADGYVKLADFNVDGYSKTNGKMIHDETNTNMRKLINSEKEDVYDFGKFLFELTTGIETFPSNENPALIHREQFISMVDANLKGDFKLNELATITEMISKCIKENPNDRPFAKDVVRILNDKLGRSLYARIDGAFVEGMDEEMGQSQNYNSSNNLYPHHRFMGNLKINLKKEIKYRPMGSDLHKPLVN